MRLFTFMLLLVLLLSALFIEPAQSKIRFKKRAKVTRGLIQQWLYGPQTEEQKKARRKKAQSSSIFTFWNIIKIIFGIAVLIGVNILQKIAREGFRVLKIQTAMGSFQRKCQSIPCNVTRKQFQQFKSWFVSHKWQLDYTFFSKQKRTRKLAKRTDTTKVTIKNIEKNGDMCYKFNLRMQDRSGASDANGLIMPKGNLLSIIFEKNYDNNRSNKFNVLIFEGEKQGDTFIGKWYYKGYQSKLSKTGQWEMYYIQDKKDNTGADEALQHMQGAQYALDYPDATDADAPDVIKDVKYD